MKKNAVEIFLLSIALLLLLVTLIFTTNPDGGPSEQEWEKANPETTKGEWEDEGMKSGDRPGPDSFIGNQQLPAHRVLELYRERKELEEERKSNWDSNGSD